MKNCILYLSLIAIYMVCVNCKAWNVKGGKSVQFKNCDDKETYLAKVSGVTIDPCSTDPCALVRGKNSTISVTFTVNSGEPDIGNTTAKVFGIVLGVRVPFSITNADGCKDCGLKCPLKAGSTYTYTYTLPILKEYPPVDCVVEWELMKGTSSKNNDSNKVFCIDVPVTVK